MCAWAFVYVRICQTYVYRQSICVLRIERRRRESGGRRTFMLSGEAASIVIKMMGIFCVIVINRALLFALASVMLFSYVQIFCNFLA